MSGGMDRDKTEKIEETPQVPDPLAQAKKILVKEALLEKKKNIDARIIELTNELSILKEKQRAIDEMVSKL